MAQQANIVVFDGATAPVSHTLVPLDNKVLKDGTRLAIWRESLASLPSEAQVRVELRQRQLPSGTVETRLRVIVPVMESVSGVNSSGYTAAPKVAYEDSNEWVSYANKRSTPISRQLSAQILRNIANNVSVTTPAITAGVMAEAVQLGFLPT